MASETRLSCLIGGVKHFWQTCSTYEKDNVGIDASKFLEITDLLLQRPDLNSTYLFRADILYDSSSIIPGGAERGCNGFSDAYHEVYADGSEEQPSDSTRSVQIRHDGQAYSGDIQWKGYVVQKVVRRRLVPRKPRIDKPIDQTCLILRSESTEVERSWLVVYLPHVSNPGDMPWYHPGVKGLAYLYQSCNGADSLSVHFLPFESSSVTPDRLHRTMLSLLSTFTRLATSQRPATIPNGDGIQSPATRSLAPADIKDTIVSQQVVQDTYTTLKHRYATDLMARWVEKTDPAKHVFEDIAIAAFLAELWKQMYLSGHFPGFVDVACGNGILVYILTHEGYHGRGFDARRRKSWEAFGLDDFLDEQLCIPQPFVEVMGSRPDETFPYAETHFGIFPKDTFIISNHADELTPWTPILAALSSPRSPLPFLAIPCCSHALSGAKWRYPPPHADRRSGTTEETEQQPATGDLKAFRADRMTASQHKDDKSMYTCLTRKVIALAEELGVGTEVTLMRIPSTRNIGIVGNRRKVVASQEAGQDNEVNALVASETAEEENVKRKTDELIERECAVSGGIAQAATTWVERAQRFHRGEGRGRVKLGRLAGH